MIVLLVEDDRKRRDEIKKHLESDTVIVLTASDNHEALKILHRTSVDHLLTDLNLEFGDGLTLAKEMKNDRLFDRIKKALYSSRPMIQDIKELAQRVGIDFCIESTDPKSVSEEALKLFNQ